MISLSLNPSKIKQLIKRTLRKLKVKPQDKRPITSDNNDGSFLNGSTFHVVSTKKNSQIVGANWLIDFKENQFSEHGEDGIIAKIFEILIPENKWVCEFGAHDPEVISNTWRLIHEGGWNAVLIEADTDCYEKLRNYYQDSQSVHCIQSMVTYEGEQVLDQILKNTPTPQDLDFMIIDIDGNDYHVWEAIKNYQAKVLMIEFNASIPTSVSFVQARDLSINHGSSLAAMNKLAKEKGYKLIAVTAWNAFFVKDEYFHLFFESEPALENMYVYPAKHPIWMRIFQLYDGTISIAPWNEMLWHNVKLNLNDYQVIPKSYRVFSRELAAKDYVLEKNGVKSSTENENSKFLENTFQMPGNILSKFARNHFSRYGEDGILEKLIEAIGAESLYFVEVGAGDGLTYSRSRNLSSVHRWPGLLIEEDKSLGKKLEKNCSDLLKITTLNQSYALSGKNSLDETFNQHGVPKEFDVMLLNVYGMEYYLWESLERYSPNIIGVQFNPTIPNDLKFIQPNDFKIHQGCSLRALLDLAHYKNYELVAVTLETAFFVKRKYQYRLFEKLGLKHTDLDEMFSPVEMHLFQLYDGTISLQGLDRLFWNILKIDEEKLQVVPACLRKFHQFADQEDKKFFYRV